MQRERSPSRELDSAATRADALPESDRRLRARAVALGERIDARSDVAGPAPSRPVVLTGAQDTAMLFRYGTVVLFDFGPERAAEFLRGLADWVTEPHATPEVEDVLIVIDPNHREGIEQGAIVLNEASVERFQIVAEILSKSVALAYEEQAVGDVFKRIEPLAVDLQRHGRVGHRSRDLVRHIGNALLVQHKTVARVEVTEKPDLLWERPDLERLYDRLEDEYELRERQTALDRKLRLISETAETVLGLLQARRSLRVEWYIVLLIVGEILLTLYQMFR